MATGNSYTVYPKKENEDRRDNLAMRPRGLRNLGNTCYFNSVMQPLCQTHAFYSQCAKTPQKGKMTFSFQTFCDQMIDGKTKQPFDPKEMRNQFIKKVERFDNHGQQDSHECLRHFLDEIRKEERLVKEATKSNDPLTAVDKIFGGHLVTVYICKECDKHYHLFEPCLDISLPVFFEAEKTDEIKTAETEKDGSIRNDSHTDYKIAIQKLVETLSSKENEEQKITLNPKSNPVHSQPSGKTDKEIDSTRKEEKTTDSSPGKRTDQISTGKKSKKNKAKKPKLRSPDHNVEEDRERNSAEENESSNGKKSEKKSTGCFGQKKSKEKKNPPKSNSVGPREKIDENQRTNHGSKMPIDGEQDCNKSTPLSFHSTEKTAHKPPTDVNTLNQPNPKSSTNQKIAISLYDCLTHFSRMEQIIKEYLCEDCLREAMARGEADEDNLKLTSATKQTLIFNPPAILTIHFKRFELLPGRSRKRSDMVEYPEYLDIAPYCSSQCLRNDLLRNNIWYSLYAVVVHSGSLEFGHYVAFVKVREREKNTEKLKKFLQNKFFNHNVTSDELIAMIKQTQKVRTNAKQPAREERNWYLVNDSSVRGVNREDVFRQEAYLLFYERVESYDFDTSL